jgi:hypothetical protein
MKINPGNIYSGDRERAVFTNPTVLAKKKGNLVGDYPVHVAGMDFPDAEAAYQKLACAAKHNEKQCYRICTKVLEAKLRQYPRILKAIQDSGGADWIRSCSHWVGYEKRTPGRWEGNGVASGYIRCLLEAYQRVTYIQPRCPPSPPEIIYAPLKNPQRPFKIGNKWMNRDEATEIGCSELCHEAILKY